MLPLLRNTAFSFCSVVQSHAFMFPFEYQGDPPPPRALFSERDGLLSIDGVMEQVPIKSRALLRANYMNRQCNAPALSQKSATDPYDI